MPSLELDRLHAELLPCRPPRPLGADAPVGTSEHDGTADTVHRALTEVIRRQRLRELADERFEDLTSESQAELRSSR